nr:excinuclease ABC subunit UvrA [PVC group bacterium]
MISDSILISGAKEHNLKDITVSIPRNRLTVVTGLSGSGKSSLAFDTLFAEGQRRYVESLSAYARRFLDQMQKPDVDHIDGLSPAIAIEQRSAGTNPRSIVATSTEIHDYLRLIYANIGLQHCPRCGQRVMRQSAEEIVDRLLDLPNRTKIILMSPLVNGRKGRHEDTLDFIAKQGFVRARVDGEIMELDSVPVLAKTKAHNIDAVIDRLMVTAKIRKRLTDSVELALKHGGGVLSFLYRSDDEDWQESIMSEKHSCASCGISFEELTPRHFSFNSPYGACSVCSGIGSMLVYDEDLLIPDSDLSIEDGAIPAWRKGGRRLILYYRRLLRSLAKFYKFDVATP